MGRAKLNMELIPKKKTRHTTYNKRKEGLYKKMIEFTTLCDVKACMIIYGPKHEETGSSEPETWPPTAEEVGRVIDIYKAKKKDAKNKTSGLSDFFDDRQRRVEDELYKLRKKIQEMRYPTRPEIMNSMNGAHLREFADALGDKVGLVRSRIEMLRRTQQHHRHNESVVGQATGLRGLIESGMINSNGNQALAGLQLPSNFYQQQNGYPATIDHNSMMRMLLMNDQVQFGPGNGGGGGGGGNILQYERQVHYDGGGEGGQGVVDPNTGMMCCSPMPLARFYDPGVPYMQMAAPQPAPLSAAYAGAYMQMPQETQFPAKVSGGGGDGDGEEENVNQEYGMMKIGAYD